MYALSNIQSLKHYLAWQYQQVNLMCLPELNDEKGFFPIFLFQVRCQMLLAFMIGYYNFEL